MYLIFYRSDRRSCKAVKGNMSILYVSGNTVRSISADGTSTIKYSEASDKIFDVDNNVRLVVLKSSFIIKKKKAH